MATPRKGARTRADVPPDILAALNAGTEQTRTLPEMLAMDFAILLRSIGRAADADELARIADQGVTKRMALAGRLVGADWPGLADHPSDTVRGWCAFAAGAEAGLDWAGRAAAIRRFADDPHFGVREWAWMAVRDHVVADPTGALQALRPWTGLSSPYLRRFASEATRPRGVWCAHIRALRADPAPALPLLRDLRADPDRYVQDSVANWLNDSAKDHPDWVRAQCAEWMADAVSLPAAAAKNTGYIVKRALRGLR